MAGTWPVLPMPQDVFEQERQRVAVRTPFESGYVQTYPKWTTGRWVFYVHWNAMLDTYRDILVDFFDSMYGGGDYFSWYNPVIGSTHNVRFFEDSIRQTYIGRGYWEVSVVLEEI